jgi:hypothetical protein
LQGDIVPLAMVVLFEQLLARSDESGAQEFAGALNGAVAFALDQVASAAASAAAGVLLKAVKSVLAWAQGNMRERAYRAFGCVYQMPIDGSGFRRVASAAELAALLAPPRLTEINEMHLQRHSLHAYMVKQLEDGLVVPRPVQAEQHAAFLRMQQPMVQAAGRSATQVNVLIAGSAELHLVHSVTHVLSGRAAVVRAVYEDGGATVMQIDLASVALQEHHDETASSVELQLTGPFEGDGGIILSFKSPHSVDVPRGPYALLPLSEVAHVALVRTVLSIQDDAKALHLLDLLSSMARLDCLLEWPPSATCQMENGAVAAGRVVDEQNQREMASLVIQAIQEAKDHDIDAFLQLELQQPDRLRRIIRVAGGSSSIQVRDARIDPPPAMWRLFPAGSSFRPSAQCERIAADPADTPRCFQEMRLLSACTAAHCSI